MRPLKYRVVRSKFVDGREEYAAQVRFGWLLWLKISPGKPSSSLERAKVVIEEHRATHERAQRVGRRVVVFVGGGRVKRMEEGDERI